MRTVELRYNGGFIRRGYPENPHPSVAFSFGKEEGRTDAGRTPRPLCQRGKFPCATITAGPMVCVCYQAVKPPKARNGPIWLSAAREAGLRLSASWGKQANLTYQMTTLSRFFAMLDESGPIGEPLEGHRLTSRLDSNRLQWGEPSGLVAALAGIL